MVDGFTVPLGKPVPPLRAQAPDGRILTGRTCRLEKLDAEKHGASLWDCARAEPADRWAYLGDTGPFAPNDEKAFADLVKAHETSVDPFFYAVVRNDGETAQGWLSLMRHDVTNGVIETGWIWLSARLSQTVASTEAMYLAMAHAFDDLGMRRYEWKCNALNAPSRSAALRLGFTFEGIFRQHQIARGLNRDTAWYSILDTEWPALKQAFKLWFSPENFDAKGRQIERLQDIRDA